MERRPISEQMREWLHGELNVWRGGGILTDDQSGQILALYETPNQAAGRRRSIAMFLISGIAALLIGLAALLVVSYNWHAMSATTKLATIFSALVGLHIVGVALRTTWQRPLTSEPIFLIACIFYGASIWLIAQIFNIQSHYPDGFWYWAIGVLPIALCLNTALLHTLYTVLLAIWVGTEVLGFQGSHLFWFGEPFVPRAAWTLPLLVLPGLVWAYRKKSVLAVCLYVPLLAWWAVLQPVAWQWRIDPIYFVGLAGILLLLAAEMHREGDRMATPYRVFGVLVVGGALIPLTFADFMTHLIHSSLPWDNCAAGLVLALFGAVGALAVVLFQQRTVEDGRTPRLELIRRQWFPLLLLTLFAGLCFWSAACTQCNAVSSFYTCGGRAGYTYSYAEKWTPQVFLPAIATNLAAIVLSLWLMRVGLREDRAWPFVFGVLYFLLWTVLRYIDLFGDVGGMLGAAVLFLLCGVGLFAVARFWLHRKEDDHVA
jgi:uncharacterized membrane protein